VKSKIENNWKLLQSVNDWIKVSDTKAIAILGTQSIFFAFIISGTISKDFHAQITSFPLILAAIAISLNFISVLFAFLSINPSLKLKGGISPLYFGSIANNFNNSKEYSDFCRNRIDDDSQVLSELEAQIYINSEIAWEKFCNVTRSIRLLTISLFVWGGFTVCMFI
jgi:hypothetical protein